VFPVLLEIPNVKTMAGEFLVLEIVVAVAAGLTWLALKLRGSEGWLGATASTIAILVGLHLLLSQFIKDASGAPSAIPIYSFGVVVILGFLAGAYFMVRQTNKLGLDGAKVFDWGFWLLVVGIVGARLLYAMLNSDQFTADKWALFRIWEGGLVWYGGLIPAAIVGIWLLTRYKLPVLHTADACAVALMLALGIGRWACFLAGDDYGKPTDSWLGIRFYNDRALIADGLRGVPLHPTQLYMSVNCLWLFFVLEWIRRRARFAGQAFAWMLILYAVTRGVFIEPFRGDFVERNPDWGRHVVAELRIDKDEGSPAVELERGAVVKSEKREGRLLQDLSLPAGEASGTVHALSDRPAKPVAAPGAIGRGFQGIVNDGFAPPWPVAEVKGLPAGVKPEVGDTRWYRSDLPQPPGYISTSQYISIGVVICGVVMLLGFRKLNAQSFADAVEEAADDEES